uniref:Yippee domain-containing protein n=1 Tax=Oryza glumipatula TaxID=40148 RepID=A0A0E0B9K8_9ORYZ
MAASATPTSSTTNVSLPSSLSSTPCSRIACLAKRFLDDPGFLAGWPQALLIGRGGLEWKSPWEKAYKENEKYKEGKSILEKTRMWKEAR